MAFAQRRNRLTTHFSERIPVVKRRMTVLPVNSRFACFRPAKGVLEPWNVTARGSRASLEKWGSSDWEGVRACLEILGRRDLLASKERRVLLESLEVMERKATGWVHYSCAWFEVLCTGLWQFVDWSVVADVSKHRGAFHVQGGGTADHVQPHHPRPKFSRWEVSELRRSFYRFDC